MIKRGCKTVGYEAVNLGPGVISMGPMGPGVISGPKGPGVIS